MQIVVTGAAGHIGSYLIRQLPAYIPESHLIMLDNMATQRYCSLFNLPANYKYKFHEVDVTENDLEEYINGTQVVIHLAAITDATASFDMAESIDEHNFKATQNVAKACAENNASLIYFSSASIYGTKDAIVTEDCSDEQINPQSPYAETKLKEENLIKKIANDYGLNFTILRLGTIYGVSPGMRFHTAVNKFCWQAAMGQPLSVWKTALDQYRPYLSLKDAVKAVSLIINKNLINNETYNVLTENITVSEIINIIRKNIPNINVNKIDSKIMNNYSYKVSSEKIMGHGFYTEGKLSADIAETIELIRQANSL